MTTTSAVTLRGDWVPDNQANCLKTDDIWQWDYGIDEDKRTVMGAPSQTTECLPTGWSSQMTYEGTKCPPRYTEACQATGETLAVVCCPTVYDFTCQPSTDLATGPHASIFRCKSQHTDTGTWVVTQTFMAAEASTSLVTPTFRPPFHLFALGIVYATPTATSDTLSTGTNVSSISDSLSSDASSSGSLSAGASAGIGVGVGAAAILLGVVGWLLLRRRKNSRLRAQPSHTEPMQQEGGYGYYQHGYTDPDKSHTQLMPELPPSGPQCPELHGQPRAELST